MARLRLAKFLLTPYSVAVVLVLAAILYLLRGKQKPALVCLVLTVVNLVVPAIPVVDYRLSLHLASLYPARKLAEYPNADVIVVLGGSAVRPGKERPEPQELGDSRLSPAARLFHLGKAPWIVVSGGGAYEWPTGITRLHTDDMTEILVGLGVPKENIIAQSRSANTQEDIKMTAELLQARSWKKALLVTNSRHMPRAMAHAERTPITFTPVPVAQTDISEPLRWESFLPSAYALGDFPALLREYWGYRALIF